jgi:ribosomal protein L21E
MFKNGDHVRIKTTKPNGEPHPHAGKTGVVTEAWITANRLTVRVDPGIKPQGFIIISRESAEKL